MARSGPHGPRERYALSKRLEGVRTARAEKRRGMERSTPGHWAAGAAWHPGGTVT